MSKKVLFRFLRKILKSEFDESFEGEKTNDYNILISTEVLAEGINLHRSNIVINYDTPWNATRLIQRIGRVNRIGTKAKQVHVYNFFPTANVEGDINLKHSNTKGDFFNLGIKNDWKKLLNNKIVEKIENAFSKEMKEMGYL